MKLTSASTSRESVEIELIFHSGITGVAPLIRAPKNKEKTIA